MEMNVFRNIFGKLKGIVSALCCDDAAKLSSIRRLIDGGGVKFPPDVLVNFSII